ncbi:MAG: large subunit ribosomal protein L2 [Sphingobacteriales bacterium]|jgi:large subunit ribosomal protein L2
MAIKRFKPMTPGTRHKRGNTFEEITASKPEKSLTFGIHKSGGRNSKGRMTMRYRGGGHKRKYRVIDFKRANFDVEGTVLSIEYDPNRSGFIALVNFADEKRYILAPKGLKVDDKVIQGEKVPTEIGNASPLGAIPLGTNVHNIELKPGKGGALARSAGSSAQLVAKDGKYAVLKMPSGETRMVLQTCIATVGEVSNSDHSLVVSGKAGRSRWLGRRPRVRGVAMNPVDHPMGGGEGKSSGGQPRSRTGLYSKGKKTRALKKYSNRYIIERRKK